MLDRPRVDVGGPVDDSVHRVAVGRKIAMLRPHLDVWLLDEAVLALAENRRARERHCLRQFAFLQV